MKLGSICLSVTDIDRSIDYYQSLGFHLHNKTGSTAVLGTKTTPLLQLEGNPALKIVNPNGPGLYHFAILLPSRIDLANLLNYVSQNKIRIAGTADHAVSEALYLTDPDGHGIEIYSDRPRETWQYSNGSLFITTMPLQINALLQESNSDWTQLPDDSSMGHIHLQVADAPEAEQFYTSAFDFELVTRYGPQASFIATDKYHHHLGLNSWQSRNKDPLPAGSARLQWFTIHLPESSKREAILNRWQRMNLKWIENEQGYLLSDPSDNKILLRS